MFWKLPRGGPALHAEPSLSMSGWGVDGGLREMEWRPAGIVAGTPTPADPHVQCHSSSPPLVQQEESGWETPCEADQQSLHKHLHSSHPDTSAADQINLLACCCQQRLGLLGGALEWKRRQVRRVRGLLAEREVELLSSRYMVPHLSAQAARAWREERGARTRLQELQTIYEEEVAENKRLHQLIQELTQRLERQGAQHAQDTRSVNERIEMARSIVRLLNQHVGTGCDEAALGTIREGLRELVELEKRMFQEKVTQAHDQSVATLSALRVSDGLLLDQARSERWQLQQCCEVLRNHTSALRCKVQWEQAECRRLEETLHQEHDDSQRSLRALEQSCQDLRQQLCEMEGGTDVPEEVSPGPQAKGMKTRCTAMENRLAISLSKGSRQDRSPVPSQGGSREGSPHPAERESDGNPGRSSRNVGRELLDPAPLATDSPVPRDLPAEERQIPSGPTGTEHQVLCRDRFLTQLPSEDDRPQSNTSSLSQWSCSWSRSSAESDLRYYVQSSLRPLSPDSLPALVTPSSHSPQSVALIPRPWSEAESPTSVACALHLEQIRSLTGRMTQRNARPKYGLRFMSYPPITTDFHINRR